MSRRAVAGAACVALLAAACVAPPVERRMWGSPAEGSFEKVALVPLRPWPRQARAGEGIGGPTALAAEDVTFMVSEELTALGIDVVPADQVASEVIGEQDPQTPFDAAAVARAVAAHFGATSVVIGQVIRYRDKTGEALGSFEPASVAFEVTLYDPEGRPVRAALFDETQKGLSENLWNAARYPGGGTRWLRADELARWGAKAAIEALVEP